MKRSLLALAGGAVAALALFAQPIRADYDYNDYAAHCMAELRAISYQSMATTQKLADDAIATMRRLDAQGAPVAELQRICEKTCEKIMSTSTRAAKQIRTDAAAYAGVMERMGAPRDVLTTFYKVASDLAVRVERNGKFNSHRVESALRNLAA